MSVEIAPGARRHLEYAEKAGADLDLASLLYGVGQTDPITFAADAAGDCGYRHRDSGPPGGAGRPDGRVEV
jgi:hypothetical protein